MEKLDTILFDLDGTLINTNEIIINSFKGTFARHYPDLSIDRNKIMTFIGPTLYETFSNYTDDSIIIQKMIETYRELYVLLEVGNFEIYPQVEEVIKKLHKMGFNLGIVTSKFKIAAWPSFTYYDLDKYFDVFVGLEDVKHPKPSRNPIDIALGRFSHHNQAIMIGDNQGDILAGKNAEIYTAGVSWSLKGSAHLMKVNPDYMLLDMNDIFRVINIINEE